MVSRAEFTLGQLAEALGATLEGDPARVVRGVAPLESAGPDDVSFLTDARYRAAAQASRAGAFVAGADVTGLPAPILTVAAPQQAMIDLLLLFHPAPPLLPGVDASAVVAGDARVDATATGDEGPPDRLAATLARSGETTTVALRELLATPPGGWART